jgi:hypothetical protein
MVKTVTNRIGLLMPDGVGLRNFVLGPFLRESVKEFAVAAMHTLPEPSVDIYRRWVMANRVEWVPLQEYRERPIPFTLRNSLAFAQMHWVKTFPMQERLKAPIVGSWRTKGATRLAKCVGRFSATPKRIRLLDRMHSAAVRRYSSEFKYYRRLLENVRPSVLFCSHQRPPIIIPAVLAAQSLNIPTCTFIFSWDNLASKGRIAAPFDHYFVWSELMRKELLQYYPDVTEDRIHIVGTPQFDPYDDESLLMSRDEFFRSLNADPNRPLVCYSGGDIHNIDDPNHVRTLLDAIRCGAIRGNPQVVLRPAPVDDGTRYDALRESYPELIYAKPAWVSTRANSWRSVIPLPEDVRFLTNITKHADLNVNFGSTMTIDFALRDKPVINVAFDVTDPPPFAMPLWDYQRKFEHYRPVIEFQAARFARSPEELALHVNDYLDNPALDRDGRRRLVELQVDLPIGRSSRKILDVLKQISG